MLDKAAKHLLNVIIVILFAILGISFGLPLLAKNAESLEQVLKREYVGNVPTESSQYDFLVGEWDVKVKVFKENGSVDSEMQGVWWAKYLHGKRVLMDDVVLFADDNKLHPGYPSLRTYSPKLGKWMSMHMAPLATQAMCRNIGEWKSGETHINSVCFKADNSVQGYSRIKFYNITAKTFDYTWEESKDNQNWRLYVTFEGKRRS